MEILRRSVEVVTFLLGAFSGFFKKVAPPDETKVAAMVGIVSFAALLILLIISAIAQGKLEIKHRKYWILTAVLFGIVFIVSAYRYDDDRMKLTMLWPP